MPLSFLEEAALNYWEQLDGPVSRHLIAEATKGNWLPALTLNVRPEDYTSPNAYLRDHAAIALLKKNPFIRGRDDAFRKASAVRTWMDAELTCYRTNQRFSELSVNPAAFGSNIEGFLSRVRANILSWVGTSISDAEMHQNARFGPGSTFESSVPNPTAADKYNEPLSLTHDACWYLFSIAGTQWFSHAVSTHGGRFLYSRGNRFTTVPKSAITDRSIAIECSLNVYFQLAVGTALRKRLKSAVGLDLDRAAEHHRKMAQLSSSDQSLATIDLSSASDTVSKNLVRFLFRHTPLLERMEDLRSPCTFREKRWFVLEKFSSMGNGYTFELETLIFLAIAWTVLEDLGVTPVIGRNISVFGDDIIIPSHCSGAVIAALRFCGFSVNTEKSFVSGPFRESCGGDYFRGVDVRGYFHKRDLAKDTESVYSLHNGAKRTFEKLGIDSPWFLGWVRDKLLSSRLRDVGGSERLGDQVLHGVSPERHKWKHQIRWVTAVSWGEKITVGWSHFPEEVRLACRLTNYGHPRGIDSRGVKPGWRKVWLSDS